VSTAQTTPRSSTDKYQTLEKAFKMTVQTNGTNGTNGTHAPKKLRIAILGCGRMGQRHAENVSDRRKSLEQISAHYRSTVSRLEPRLWRSLILLLLLMRG